jgi:MoaA/NifB/PqqE/SkfB family radical SAM enzyme
MIPKKGEILSCVFCGNDNFICLRDQSFGEVVSSKDFKGIGEVPDPKEGECCSCHYCGKNVIDGYKRNYGRI